MPVYLLAALLRKAAVSQARLWGAPLHNSRHYFAWRFIMRNVLQWKNNYPLLVSLVEEAFAASEVLLRCSRAVPRSEAEVVPRGLGRRDGEQRHGLPSHKWLHRGGSFLV